MALLPGIALVCSLAQDSSTSIRIVDRSAGCFHEEGGEYEWRRDGDGYVRGGSRISVADVEAIRKRVTSCRKDPPDLLAQVGFTPASLAAHRDALFELLAPATWREGGGRAKSPPPQVERLFDYERLAETVRDELTGRNRRSTNSFDFKVELPGEPRVRVESDGLVPWMLPWTITVGTESWSVADPAVPRALLALADSDGACARLIDGREYWEDRFWEDDFAWGRFLLAEIEQEIANTLNPTIDGFAAFDTRFEIVKTSTGAINLQPESSFHRLRTRKPALIDSAWWWNPIEKGMPTRTWTDFLGTYDYVAARALRHGWLAEWKLAGVGRTIEAHIVGTTPHSETMIPTLVQPAWDHAGLKGSPEIELLFRRGEQWCGTIFLASGEPRVLIETARPGAGNHWFDALDFSFHPRAKPPTYAIVDSEGRCEVRHMPEAR
jgi:hypothetical protein